MSEAYAEFWSMTVLFGIAVLFACTVAIVSRLDRVVDALEALERVRRA